MAVVIDSKKDTNSFACRHNFGGVYINGKFYADGTEVPPSVLDKLTNAQRERYTRTKTIVASQKKTTAKPKATAKKATKPAPKKSTATAKTKTATKRKSK